MKNLKGLFVLMVCLAGWGSSQAQQIKILGYSTGLSPVNFIGTNSSVDINFQNNTITTITTADFYFEINGTPYGPTTWNGNLNAGQTGNVSTLQTFAVPSGQYSICVYSSSPSSDTLCHLYAGCNLIAPVYLDDFDGVNNGWAFPNRVPDTIQTWVLNTPNYGTVNSAHSGSNSWVIGRDFGYSNNMQSYLYSPFFDIDASKNYALSFWQNRKTEQNWDGVRIEYTPDMGLTWNVLGIANDPNGSNWYSSASINSSSQPAWDGTSGGWQKSTHSLNFGSSGQVQTQFRFVFTSDASVTMDGFALDDFSIDSCNLSVSLITTNATCFNQSDGNITATATGGLTPYNFLWSNGSTTQSLTAISAGTYTITVSDSNGCVVTDVAVVSQATQIVVTQISSTPATCGNSNGSVCVTASGGYGGPYLFDFGTGPGASNCTPNNLAAGVYVVTVTDAFGCTGQCNAIVSNTSGPVINISSPVTVCAGVNLCANVTGGAPPYIYIWNIPNGPPSTAPCIIPIISGNYILTVTDINNCSTIQAFTVYVDSLEVGFAINSCPSGPGMCDGSFTFFPIGGGASYTYQVNGSPVAGTTLNNVCDGSPYDVLITDANGCSAFQSIILTPACDDVWPGDANHDQVADNFDLLSIGLAYGATGPVRPGANITWTGQPAPDWGLTLPGGTTDYKHADCNGDSIIDFNDTTAIVQNYGLTHTYRLMQSQVLPGGAQLYFNIVIDTAGTGQTFDVSVNLGTSNSPANNVYGIACTINYDKTLVKADSMGIDFSNCWMGTMGNDLIAIAHNDTAIGQLHVGISRTNHINTTGYGELARVTVVTTDNVSGKITSAVFDTLFFSFSNISLIDASGNEISYTIGDGSVIVEDLTGLNDQLTAADVKIYPNPVKDKLVMKLSADFSIEKIWIKNTAGQIVYSDWSKKNNTVEIKGLDKLSNGIYFLDVVTDKGSVIKKFGIVH